MKLAVCCLAEARVHGKASKELLLDVEQERRQRKESGGEVWAIILFALKEQEQGLCLLRGPDPGTFRPLST
jgi:hypothetical protein